ncbi:MAG: molybdenum cofactor guanylyltransferase [Thermogemmata sp.]|nr:molybdenum cofactor guanylyltransferase [Gemmataceae bacterium]
MAAEVHEERAGRVAGILLCGGQSRRMGRPKEWLDFGGVPLLEHMLRHLREAVREVVVVAAPGQSLPPLPREVVSSVRLVRDPVPYPGPLVGLLTGWLALPPEVEAALVLAVDMPGVPPALLRQWLQWLEEEPAVEAVVPYLGDRWQPLLAAYRRCCLPVLQALVEQGNRRLQDLPAALKVRPVSLDQLRALDPRGLSLANLNTPADYAAALAELVPSSTSKPTTETLAGTARPTDV